MMVLPKSMRLKGHKCFDHLYRDGARFHSESMVLRVAKAKPELNKTIYKSQDSKNIKCAIAISSKVNKKAVIRNRIRRKFHDHLAKRLDGRTENSKTWALLSLKPYASVKEISTLTNECDKLLFKAGLI